ncbi:MAG: hypothetical protein M1817_001329 [Caeruleum heppii]|nr:MAG: hypothetical protein M1817_001329 [Caeruleum heppii]
MGPSKPSTGASPTPAAQDPATALEQTLGLLQSRDDTSRFVGLALLKSILDNQRDYLSNITIISRCWDAIPVRFLDRLLRATEGEKRTIEDAKNMVDLAVAVIHTFVVLLPSDRRDGEKMTGRSAGLVAALASSSPETTTNILQTLLTITSGARGYTSLWQVENLRPLTSIAPEQPLALDVIERMVLQGAQESTPNAAQIDKLFNELVLDIKNDQIHIFFRWLADTLPSIPPEALSPNPPWLSSLVGLIHKIFSGRPSFVAREAGTLICSTLIQLYSDRVLPLLFCDPSPSSDPDATSPLYLFLNLILIDIRSTFPSLMEILASPEYLKTARRVAAGFDVVTAFIGFLIRSMGESLDDDEDGEPQLGSLTISPDLLLKLRRDVAETMSLTIEFFRDRWDSAVAGAAGLDVTARPQPGQQRMPGVPLTLGWDSPEGGIGKDGLILGALRALGLWLREDDNEALRAEAAGIVDALLGLFSMSSEIQRGSDTKVIDFRQPVLTALEGIVATDDGVAAFLREDGWEVLSKDLNLIIGSAQNSSPAASLGEHIAGAEMSRGIEIIRILLVVTENVATTAPGDERLAMVRAAASVSFEEAEESSDVANLEVSMFQLAAELLIRAPVNVRRRYRDEAANIERRSRTLAVTYSGTGGNGDIVEGATEVISSMESLGFNSNPS